ncbi:hypothetical protein KC953_02755 [Candidatus Saccharibacteria bacterium]|nr:hypothetical protein [Candidatus Saccharibacteria bacterium]
MNDSEKVTIDFSNLAPHLHIGLVMHYMQETLEKPLIGFIKEFSIYGRALRIDFDDDALLAMDLIVRERMFLENPCAESARHLGSLWCEWARQSMDRLRRHAAPRQFPNLECRLDDFVDSLDVARQQFVTFTQ